MFKEKKDFYGPIASSLLKATDMDVVYLGSKLKDYEHIIIFHNNTLKIEKLPHQKVSWWMCDLRPPETFPKLDIYDNIFLCNKHFAQDYKDYFKANVHYLPQCGDDRDTPPKGRLIQDDVVFIGNLTHDYHSNRPQIINEIKKTHSLVVVQGETYTPDTKFIYKHTPFSLAISEPVEGYTSNRLYNILSSGGFCLTLYFPGIEDLFENHKHLVWFEDAKEVAGIIEYYYEHPEEYENVKKNGLEIYKNNHTALHRLQEIISVV